MFRCAHQILYSAGIPVYRLWSAPSSWRRQPYPLSSSLLPLVSSSLSAPLLVSPIGSQDAILITPEVPLDADIALWRRWLSGGRSSSLRSCKERWQLEMFAWVTLCQEPWEPGKSIIPSTRKSSFNRWRMRALLNVFSGNMIGPGLHLIV